MYVYKNVLIIWIKTFYLKKKKTKNVIFQGIFEIIILDYFFTKILTAVIDNFQKKNFVKIWFFLSKRSGGGGVWRSCTYTLRKNALFFISDANPLRKNDKMIFFSFFFIFHHKESKLSARCSRRNNDIFFVYKFPEFPARYARRKNDIFYVFHHKKRKKFSARSARRKNDIFFVFRHKKAKFFRLATLAGKTIFFTFFAIKNTKKFRLAPLAGKTIFFTFFDIKNQKKIRLASLARRYLQN